MAGDAAGKTVMDVSEAIRFGEFSIDPGAYEVVRSGKVVALEPQVFSLLVYLVEHHSRVVTKEELLDELWGHRFVSESALSTQIKALRKALGDSGRAQRLIKTVHGRGYRFVAPIGITDPAADSAPDKSPVEQSNVGRERSRLFGREGDLARIEMSLQNNRLVSLLGIGGTGKTKLAKALARQQIGNYPAGVWFVDLVPVRDGSGLDRAIADVIGIRVDDRRELARALSTRRTLVILDNCEHIEEEVALALDDLLTHTQQPRFLVTSRDPLDLEDELRLFIEPFDVANDDGAQAALTLFKSTAERHGASPLGVEDAQIIDLCRHLDGLPLAIELAAAQLRQLSLAQLNDRLDRRFELLAGRQRVSSGRQSGLQSVLEETWLLLQPAEQGLLCTLASFAGEFTMEDAEGLASGDGAFASSMARIVELCLIQRTPRQGAWWRLLESVRLFALGKLNAAARKEAGAAHAAWVKAGLAHHLADAWFDFSRADWAAQRYHDVVLAFEYLRHKKHHSQAAQLLVALTLAAQSHNGFAGLIAVQYPVMLRARLGDELRVALVATASEVALAQTRFDEAQALLLSIEDERYLARAENQDQRALLGGSIATSRALFGHLHAALPELLADQTDVSIVRWLQARGQMIDLALGRCDAPVALAAFKGMLRGADEDLAQLEALTGACISALFDAKEEVSYFLRQLIGLPAGSGLARKQWVKACAYAWLGDDEQVAGLYRTLRRTQAQAGQGLPVDWLVPCILRAWSHGETAQAGDWLGVLVRSGISAMSVEALYLRRELSMRLTPGSPGASSGVRRVLTQAWRWAERPR